MEIRIVAVHGHIAHEVDAQVREVLGGDYHVQYDYLEGGWEVHYCTNVPCEEICSIMNEILDVAYTSGDPDLFYAKRGLLAEPFQVDSAEDQWFFLGNIHGYNEDGSGLYQE